MSTKVTAKYLSSQEIQAELRALESKHGMTTRTFLSRFRAGKIGHDHDRDWVRWVGLQEMAKAVGKPRAQVDASSRR